MKQDNLFEYFENLDVFLHTSNFPEEVIIKFHNAVDLIRYFYANIKNISIEPHISFDDENCVIIEWYGQRLKELFIYIEDPDVYWYEKSVGSGILRSNEEGYCGKEELLEMVKWLEKEG